MNKRDIVLLALGAGLIYTGWTTHNLQKQQSDISSSLDHVEDQTELAAIHRSYNPAQSVDITAEIQNDLSESESELDTTVSIQVNNGEFNLNEVEVTAYDKLKNEIYSVDEDAGFNNQMLRNMTQDFTFGIPIRNGNTDTVRLIEVTAVDETAYIEEDGSFGYGTEYKGKDIGVNNPSQLFLVEKKCLDDVEGLEKVCFHRLEPIQSYEVPAPMVEIHPPIENPDDKIHLNVTS